jgi:hypothetical protein
MIGHPNLKGWWRLDGSSVDSSGSGFNGTDTNITYGAYGKYGGGILLQNVNGYISCGDNLDFEYTNPITVACWLKVVGTGYCNILGKQDNAGVNAGWGLSYNGGLGMFMYYGGTQAKNYFACKFPTTPTTELHHVAYTYDGSNTYNGIKLYYDGVEVTKTSVSEFVFINSLIHSAPFQISGRGGGNYCMNGQIDDAQIYNKVIPVSDIKRIMMGLHPLTRS